MAEPATTTVAVLGTGTMGAPMARNMAAAGLPVRAWNRTREKAEALTDQGIAVAATPSEAVAGASLVVTMLADADAVIATMEEAIDAMDRDAVWVQAATVGIAGIERSQALAEEHHVALVDAPVLGTKGPAEEGTLIVLAAGAHAALERCAPAFEAIGSKTVRLGQVGEATRLKVVLNHWILALVEGLAETVALAEGIDVDPELFLETISGGPLDAGYAQTKGRAMASRELAPSFALELAAKDADLVREAAARHDLHLPLIETVAAQLRRAADAGHGREDMAAAIHASAPQSRR